MMFWLVVAGWLVACAVVAVWAWRRVKRSDIEEDHEEAIDEDRRWENANYPVRLQTEAEWAQYERAVLTGKWIPPVPPILNQSERWLGQERAREAESADDFWDAPTPPRAA